MQERREGRAGDDLRGDHPETGENPLDAASRAASELTGEEDLPYGSSEADQLRGELDALNAEHTALHDKYVRLHAEFDNFRKRTAKERLELLQMAGAETLRSILPVLDDMERAKAHNAEVEDITAVKEGFELIHQKFINLLTAQGLKVMEAKGQPFDPEFHEAISKMPAPSAALKGKVLEVVENGYLLNDKVLRYAKVVVGD